LKQSIRSDKNMEEPRCDMKCRDEADGKGEE